VGCCGAGCCGRLQNACDQVVSWDDIQSRGAQIAVDGIEITARLDVGDGAPTGAVLVTEPEWVIATIRHALALSQVCPAV
jgi:hypothetical protein